MGRGHPFFWLQFFNIKNLNNLFLVDSMTILRPLNFFQPKGQFSKKIYPLKFFVMVLIKKVKPLFYIKLGYLNNIKSIKTNVTQGDHIFLRQRWNLQGKSTTIQLETYYPTRNQLFNVFHATDLITTSWEIQLTSEIFRRNSHQNYFSEHWCEHETKAN